MTLAPVPVARRGVWATVWASLLGSIRLTSLQRGATVGSVKRVGIIAAGVVLGGLILVVILAVLQNAGQSSAANDQEFLHLTDYNDSLANVDVVTRVQLGHEMCADLGRFHGDRAEADAALARGYESTFTPTVVESLRSAAVATYCPKWG